MVFGQRLSIHPRGQKGSEIDECASGKTQLQVGHEWCVKSLAARFVSSSKPWIIRALALEVGWAILITRSSGIPAHSATLNRPNFRELALPEHSNRTGPFGSTYFSSDFRDSCCGLVHVAVDFDFPVGRRVQHVADIQSG